jgi:hypothetical protein
LAFLALKTNKMSLFNALNICLLSMSYFCPHLSLDGIIVLIEMSNYMLHALTLMLELDPTPFALCPYGLRSRFDVALASMYYPVRNDNTYFRAKGTKLLTYNINIKPSTAYGIRHTPYVIRHTSYVIRHTAYGIRHTSYGIRHTAYVIRHTAYVIRHTPYVIRHTSYTS